MAKLDFSPNFYYRIFKKIELTANNTKQIPNNGEHKGIFEVPKFSINLNITTIMQKSEYLTFFLSSGRLLEEKDKELQIQNLHITWHNDLKS